jgi:hypothetical protein
VVSSGLTINSGSAGSGGAAGIAAPATEGTAEDDGNDGSSGFGGQLLTTLVGGACAEALPTANADSPTCEPATCTIDVPGAIGATAFAFAGIAPHPVVGAARFEFSLPAAGPVRLALYDVTGGQVHVVLDGPADAGPQVVGWDGRNAGGSRLAAGVYFARLEFGGRALTRRMIVVRSR